MTTRHDAAYFEQLGYGVAQIAYFENYPVFPAIFWTVGVFGAVAASVLLLLRSRYTVPVALVALCAQAGLDVISFGFMDRLRVFGVRQSAFDILVPLGLAAVLYWYAVGDVPSGCAALLDGGLTSALSGHREPDSSQCERVPVRRPM